MTEFGDPGRAGVTLDSGAPLRLQAFDHGSPATGVVQNTPLGSSQVEAIVEKDDHGRWGGSTGRQNSCDGGRTPVGRGLWIVALTRAVSWTRERRMD
jgi:hypothetical protein